jgi:hypothetical protein
MPKPPSKFYKLAFQVAAVVVPTVAGLLAAAYGDYKPIVRDVCDVLLSADVTPSPEPVDAGAPR